MRKTSVVCVLLAVLAAALSGCTPKAYGTQKMPAGISQTVIYDGTSASKEENRFKAEITLQDVVRGTDAEDIFAAAGGYASYHEPLELGDDQELLVARFTFTLTDWPGDTPVELGQRDVNMFKLISEDGNPYDYFLQRRFVKGNLFGDASVGSTQTGCLFYLVDEEDEKPNIVFMPSVNEGVWFKTSLTGSDRKLVDDPIMVSDWLNAGEKDIAFSMGTFNTPLPIGEYGYMYCQSPRFGEYEIEIRVDEILRGSEVDEQLNRLDSYGYYSRNLKDNQEFLLVKLTVNAPSVDMLEESFLDFYVGDCRVINSNTGQEYDFEDSLDFMDDSITAVMPGGSSEGWFGYVIDKNDPSPMMLYQSLNDKILYFKLDQAYELPDDQEPYVSVIPKQNPIRDTSSAKGDWKNPYGLEDTIKLDYNPSSAYRQNAPFVGNIQVLEAYRGEAAAYFLEDDYYSDHYQKLYMDPVVLKINVKIDSMETDAAPSFDGRNFTVLSGRGGVIGNPVLPQSVFKEDGIDRVYQGGTVEGYVGFLVPKDLKFMEITYGDIYDRIDTAWINLEFSEEHPEEIITGQERMDMSADLGKYSYIAEKENYDSIISYEVEVDNGQVTGCTEKTTYFYAGRQDSFLEDLEQYESTIGELDELNGIKGTVESDSVSLTISIILEVDFDQVNTENIISIFESPYYMLTDENGKPSWKKAKESLENNGYIFR